MSDQVCYDAPTGPRWQDTPGKCTDIKQYGHIGHIFEFMQPSERQYLEMRQWLIDNMGNDYVSATITVCTMCRNTFLLDDKGWSNLHRPGDYSEESVLRAIVSNSCAPMFKLQFC